MKVEIITIGDEILIGQIIDTNSAWMAQKLNDIGGFARRVQGNWPDKPMPALVGFGKLVRKVNHIVIKPAQSLVFGKTAGV